jgi:hypothetical protein
LVDGAGHLLQVDSNGSGVCRLLRLRDYLWSTRLFALLRDLPLLAAGVVVAAVARPSIRSSRNAAGTAFGLRYRPLQLVSATLSSLPDVEIIEDDILIDSPYRGAFDVLRAANILNRSYFDEATLNSMVKKLRRRLRPGGLMIVCRSNHDHVNNASIFRLAPDGSFEVLARLNAGSEVEAL